MSRSSIARAWFLAGSALALAAAVALAQSPPPQSARMDQALIRLAELEDRIAQVRRRQQIDQARLLQAGQALDANAAGLQSRAQTADEAKAFLQQYSQDRGAQRDALQRPLLDERQTARDAQRQARLAAGLLAWQVSTEAPDPRALAALALIARRQRDQAQVAAARALRLEGERSDAQDALVSAAAGAQYYSAFEQYSLAQLRDQQQQLVDEVARLQAAFDEQSGELARLARQREELAALVQRLLEQPPQSPANPAAPSPAPQPQANPPLAAVPDEERGEPIPAVSLEAMGGGLAQAGARRLFWHATPVTVQALAPGRVVFSGAFAGYRHLLIVDLGGGWHALYGNLTACDAKVGDALQAGQPVGAYQAAQGNKAEPFWLEIRRGVDAVPPEQCPNLPPDWQERLFSRVQP